MGDALDALDTELEWPEFRAALIKLAEQTGEWQGIPVPIDDFAIRLCEGHPMRGFYDPPDVKVQVLVGGPPHEDPIPDDTDDLAGEIVRRSLDDSERVVNHWYDGKRNREVYIFQRANGRAFAVTRPRAPDRSMERLDLAMRTLGASDAWGLDAELTAREKLKGQVTERQWWHYELTGSFLETSRRSGLTYLFRRLRPTVAITPRWPWWKGPQESVRCLAVLCLHPIGYYDDTWAGCLTPTDDVLAHLLFMRGDEAGFWRHANQHDPAAPEAGL